MILFFTGTGNSQYLANRISEKTNDCVISITDALHEEKFNFIVSEGENLGFVMPVYFSGVPKAVKDFLKKANFSLKGDNYVFSALTCGGLTSGTGKMLSSLLSQKGITVSAEYGIKMVDNYIYMYSISDEKEAIDVLKGAEDEIQKIALSVCEKKKGIMNSVHGPSVMTKFMYPLYKIFRKTKPFYVNGNCNGCGKCERECPEKAISVKSGKAVWVKKECSHCVRCIHSCPKKAIEMGKKTAGRNRYMNPYV